MKKIIEFFPYIIPALTAVLYRVVLPATFVDDAYITMHTARNLAIGNGMVFNAGERVFAITTVLWTLFNAALRVIGIDSITAVWVLGLVCEVTLAILIVALGKQLLKNAWAGALASVLLITNPVYVITSLGGMEVALSMCAIVLAFLLLAKHRPGWALTVAAIAVWVRIDNLALLGIIAAWTILEKILLKNGDDIVVNRPLKGAVQMYIPPALIVAAYFIIAQLYYNTPVPISVFRKAAFPGKPWIVGMPLVVREFLFVLMGKSSAYLLKTSPLWVTFVPLIVGVVFAFKRRIRGLLPLTIFSVVYMLAYILVGQSYATLFPWYFVPPLVIVSLLASFGILELMRHIKERFPRTDLALGLITLLWAGSMLMHNHIEAVYYRDNIYNCREKVYAAATVWLGAHLAHDATICGGEIGAMGFFNRPDIYILDMVGLTRPIGDNRLPVNLVKEEQPEAIVYMPLSHHKFEDFTRIYPEYEWGTLNGVMIGIRHDLAPTLLQKSNELPVIFKAINMEREFEWTHR